MVAVPLSLPRAEAEAIGRIAKDRGISKAAVVRHFINYETGLEALKRTEKEVEPTSRIELLTYGLRNLGPKRRASRSSPRRIPESRPKARAA